MSRTVGIPCRNCRRSFGGDETFRRHRFSAGDRFVCYSDEQLVAKGMWRDRSRVWHRGTNPDQMTLLGPTEADRAPSPEHLARVTDPETSKAAARALSGRAGTIRRKLLQTYYLAGEGLTAEEAAYQAGFRSEDGPWKRVSDLLNAGLLRDTGERRPASSGRMQRVLRVTESGRQAIG